MPVKITATGLLDVEAGIRQYGDVYVFEVLATASKSAPKGLPVPTDETVSVICNAKQLRAVRELLEGGDKIIAMGEVCGDFPARQAFGTLAMVAFSLTTTSLEAAKKGDQAAAGREASQPTTKTPEPAPKETAPVEGMAATGQSGAADPGPRWVRLADIVVPPALLNAKMNPAKTEQVRKEIQSGIMPPSLLVAQIGGQLVLQDGYRRLLLLREFGHDAYTVELSDRVLFGPDTRELPQAKPAGAATAQFNPNEHVSCARCQQSMLAQAARRRRSQILCPDCDSGQVNPVTDRRLPILERGFPPTPEAVGQLVEMTGVPAEDGALQTRLIVVLGCMVYLGKGERRFAYNGVLAKVRDGRIVQVGATSRMRQPFPSLATWLETARAIEQREAEQAGFGRATGEQDSVGK